MDIDFWQQRWSKNQTGFHLPEVNSCITRFWAELEVNMPSTVLVPLCGKTLDMVWLASQGYSVLGVECSHKAIAEFYSEQKLTAVIAKHRNFTLHHHAQVSLLEGDFFKLDNVILQNVSAVYDRASLIALPDHLRSHYVDLLTAALPEHASILLITLEYQQAVMQGPPFSVSHNEVRRLYQESFDISLLHERNIINESPGFSQKGLDILLECVYKITR